MISTIIVSLGVSVLNTHALGSESFGTLKFFQTLFTLVLTLSTYGCFVAGGRLFAKSNNSEDKRSLTGVMLIIVGLITSFMMSVLLCFSYLDLDVLKDGRDNILRLAIPLLFALPLQLFLENSLKGDNRIFELALLRVFPGLFYLAVAYWIQQVDRLNLNLALNLYMIMIGSVCLIMLVRLNPNFKNFKNNFQLMLNETKRFGRHVYIGTISNVGSTQFGSIALAFFIDTTSVGHFVLARTIAAPLTMIATNVGIAFFNTFAHSKSIPIKVVYVTLGMSGVTLIAFYMVIGVFIDRVYPEEFKVILPLIYIIAMGSVVQGIGGFVNNFLCAHGHGKKSRNAAFLQGFINCLGFTFLVYWLGVIGAALTVLLASLSFTLMVLYFYRKVQWSQNG